MNTCSQPRCQRPLCPSPSMRARDDWSVNNFPLAMAYVPMQRFKTIYEADEALQCGTIFPELHKHFMGWKGGRPC